MSQVRRRGTARGESAIRICPRTRKLSFPTRAEAKKFVRNRPNLAHRRVYQCEFCSEWHATSQERAS